MSPESVRSSIVPLRFRPVDATFYDMFTKLANQLVQGSSLLAEMLSDTSDRPAIVERMREEEHLADEATHDIIKRVNSTFVTPFDREDIYDLASNLDDVMDYMEEAVDLIQLYEIGHLPEELSEQAEVLRRCAELTAATMPSLKTMKGLDEYWIEINRLENTGDKTYRRILAKLFSGQYEALEVLKLKDVVESLEDAIDAFEKVANTIEQIAVKES
jgi:predicted phosphate transport protein (TIGR00153 family)